MQTPAWQKGMSRSFKINTRREVQLFGKVREMVYLQVAGLLVLANISKEEKLTASVAVLNAPPPPPVSPPHHSDVTVSPRPAGGGARRPAPAPRPRPRGSQRDRPAGAARRPQRRRRRRQVGPRPRPGGSAAPGLPARKRDAARPPGPGGRCGGRGGRGARLAGGAAPRGAQQVRRQRWPCAERGGGGLVPGGAAVGDGAGSGGQAGRPGKGGDGAAEGTGLLPGASFPRCSLVKNMMQSRIAMDTASRAAAAALSAVRGTGGVK
ncbi:unnamed protein product [Coccothraustes coccothraustes]